MLRAIDVDPEAWVGTEYCKADVLRFLFLRGLWEIARRATPGVFTQEVVDRELSRAESDSQHQLDPAIPILGRMLNAGISPEEVSEFVASYRLETVYQILYFLDDPAGVFSFDISENMRFHLYTENESEKPIPSSREDWSFLFQWFGQMNSGVKPSDSGNSA